MSDIMGQAQDEVQQLADQLSQILADAGLIGADSAALEQALADSGVDVEGIDRATYMQALDQALEENGVPLEVREQVADQLDAQPDFDPLQHLTIVVNDNDVTNNIDQSLHVDGEVHGDVYQANSSNVANATGEGAIAGEEVYGNQVQTGDGQQVGGDSGVQNQGNNSGQQAGESATADNVTTGDGNSIGSGAASGIGEGQVSQDYATIEDSSQAFGEGAATNTAPDSEDYHSEVTSEATATDSFNYDDSDTNTQTQTINDHAYGEPEHDYEPSLDHDDYKADDHHDDDYDDYDQDAEIVEID